MKFLIYPLLLLVPALGQHPKPKSTFNPATVDKIPPPGCGLHLVTAGTYNGSPAFIRLAILSSALSAADEATEAQIKQMEEIKASHNYTQLVSSILENTSDASNLLRCAADIVSIYKPHDQNDKNWQFNLIIAFNQESHALEIVKTSQLRRMSRGNYSSDRPVTAISDARDLSSALSLQKESADILTEGTVLAILESFQEMKEDGIPPLAMTCAERDQVLAILPKTRDSKQQTAYSQTADLIRAGLPKHSCQREAQP